ncbi:hypothetical protein ALI22I_23215 [Saccharothrix sp. ALI-22-I]|nr:hypothetical protein ALI22I_23215 [Saccharothrix sp. ALI-22-I]
MDRLCFGTSTFVAGRLRPEKESEPGMAALHAAVSAGVRLVHSNPKLGTQWAVRRVLDSASTADVSHLVKAEVPLGADLATMRSRIMLAIEESCTNLGVDQLRAVTVEIDLKRTQDQALLVNSQAVMEFYANAAEVVRGSGRVSQVIAYCHSPAHLAAASLAEDVHGVAAQYNVAEPWPALFLDDIERRGLQFVGMSPLRRGTLAAHPSGAADLTPLRWVVTEPRISSVVITMSSPRHLRQVIKAVRSPLEAPSVHELASAWLNAQHRHASPEGTGWSPADRLLSSYLPAQEDPRD